MSRFTVYTLKQSTFLGLTIDCGHSLRIIPLSFCSASLGHSVRCNHVSSEVQYSIGPGRHRLTEQPDLAVIPGVVPALLMYARYCWHSCGIVPRCNIPEQRTSSKCRAEPAEGGTACEAGSDGPSARSPNWPRVMFLFQVEKVPVAKNQPAPVPAPTHAVDTRSASCRTIDWMCNNMLELEFHRRNVVT